MIRYMVLMINFSAKTTDHAVNCTEDLVIFQLKVPT